MAALNEEEGMEVEEQSNSALVRSPKEGAEASSVGFLAEARLPPGKAKEEDR